MDGDTSQDLRYAPPQAHVEDVEAPEGGLVLATRMQRFWAAMIDMVVVLLAFWLLSVATPWNPWVRQSGLWTPSVATPLLGFMTFAIVHGILLARRGQTIGKFLLGLRIVRSDGERASLLQVLLLRYGVGYLSTILLPLGQLYGLVDALMIFRSSRRCLHDLIAGTIVVKA